ncbi:WYL domain-containing protein [Spongiactinospora sp. 9N601]|uniref:WYL domain-containing protein n=1 Tax=Spongiactinospora sp. 9N601 TaxID=3375149 RepID=UPI00379199C2
MGRERQAVGDLLRFGPDAEVIAPEHLRERMAEALVATAGRYGLTVLGAGEGRVAITGGCVPTA